MGRNTRPQPASIDRLSPDDRRVVRRLARSLRGWDLPPGSQGRQGELAGAVAIRIEQARDVVRRQVTAETSEGRRHLARLASIKSLLADRERQRKVAESRLAEIQREVVAGLDWAGDRPRGSSRADVAGPPIPWTRLLLVTGFVVLEYFLSLPVPHALSIDGYSAKVVAFAFAMALVVLPKTLGSSLRDGATSDAQKRRVPRPRSLGGGYWDRGGCRFIGRAARARLQRLGTRRTAGVVVLAVARRRRVPGQLRVICPRTSGCW